MDFSILETLSPLLGTTSALLLAFLCIVWKDLVRTREKLWKSFLTINDNTAALKAVEKMLEKQEIHLNHQGDLLDRQRILLAELKGRSHLHKAD